MIDDTQTVVKEANAEEKDNDGSHRRESHRSADSRTNSTTSEIERGETRSANLTAVAEPPGRILRRAREEKGLEQIEIARELKLDVGLIDALERGDLHRLPPVYAAGYIRAYAKRVELDADELVAEYIAQEATHTPKLKKDSNPLPERYRRVAEALPKGFSLAAANAKEQLTKNYGPLAAGVVILLLLVWQVFSIWSSDEAASGSDIVAMQSADSDASLKMPTEKEQADSLNAQIAVESGSQSSSGKEPSTATQQSAKPAAEKTNNAENQAGKTPPDSAKSELAEKTQAPASKNENENIDAIALLEKKNSTNLVLTFNRNSWVDIRDATGKHIIRQLGIAGNTQKVSGQAPFQVLLGYGHGVTIEYNGNEVDFSAFQGDRVARFTLEVPKKKLTND